MMTDSDFVSSLFGFYGDDPALTFLYEEFDVEYYSSDIYEILDDLNTDTYCKLRNLLVCKLWNDVVNNICDEYGHDLDYRDYIYLTDCFDSYINGNLDTTFYFKGEEITSKEELIKKLKENNYTSFYEKED